MEGATFTDSAKQYSVDKRDRDAKIGKSNQSTSNMRLVTIAKLLQTAV